MSTIASPSISRLVPRIVTALAAAVLLLGVGSLVLAVLGLGAADPGITDGELLAPFRWSTRAGVA